MRFWIVPLAPFRYDENGILYPFSYPFDVLGMLKEHQGKSFSWREPPSKYKVNLWYQEKVLCFSSVNDLKSIPLPYGLKIAERIWK